MPNRVEQIRRRVLAALAEQPMFAGLSGAALSALADRIEWFALAGGSLLFDQGEASDGMFLLVHGRLSASRRDAEGKSRSLGIIAPGESVGETGLLALQPRYARVVALRDSELLFLPRSGFESLASSHPDVLLKMAQLALRRSYSSAGSKPRNACFALLPATPGMDMADFARRFAEALGDTRAELIDADRARDKPSPWFGEREVDAVHLLYVGNDDAEWRERCVRQSDCVLLVADASRPPQLQTCQGFGARGPAVPCHLLLLSHRDPHWGATRDWLEYLPQAHAHHHVRYDRDLRRVVRHLTGRATGLVLSGGGARGFAHLGVVRALREAGWNFDYVGGTSIGAIIGAGVAADWDDATLREVYRTQFVTTNPLAGWTLPLTSLRSGAGVVAGLRRAFGKREIEDLAIPFYCVSSDLTEGGLEVHETGPLWRALRASSAIPGVLPPLLHAGKVLVDGGVVDNLPVGEMRKRLVGDIIAVDVGGQYRLQAEIDEAHLPPWWKLIPELLGRKRRPGIGQILLRSGMVNSAATSQRARKQTRLLLAPPLDGIDLLDWQAFDRAEAAGYEYTVRHLHELALGPDAA